jgi:hypothetical protein
LKYVLDASTHCPLSDNELEMHERGTARPCIWFTRILAAVRGVLKLFM